MRFIQIHNICTIRHSNLSGVCYKISVFLFGILEEWNLFSIILSVMQPIPVPLKRMTSGVYILNIKWQEMKWRRKTQKSTIEERFAYLWALLGLSLQMKRIYVSNTPNETQPPSFLLNRDAFPAPFVWLFYQASSSKVACLISIPPCPRGYFYLFNQLFDISPPKIYQDFC